MSKKETKTAPLFWGILIGVGTAFIAIFDFVFAFQNHSFWNVIGGVFFTVCTLAVVYVLRQRLQVPGVRIGMNTEKESKAAPVFWAVVACIGEAIVLIACLIGAIFFSPIVIL